MADKRVYDVPELTTPDDNDFINIIDVSDTTDSPEGSLKKIKKTNLVKRTGMVWSRDLILNLVHTGDTIDTYMYTVELPKQYLEGSGSIMFEIRGEKSATAAISRISANLNTSDISTGEQSLAISESGSTTNTRNPSMQRRFLFNPTTIQHVNTVVTATDFSSANNVKHQISTLSLKDNNFLRIYIQNGSAGVATTIYGIAVKIYNND